MLSSKPECSKYLVFMDVCVRNSHSECHIMDLEGLLKALLKNAYKIQPKD